MSENNINIDDLTSNCLQCGVEFIPDESGQECCDNDCDAVYYGWDHWIDDDQEWSAFIELDDYDMED